MEPIAHLRLVEKSEPPEYDEQTLKAHNENSGKYAAEALRCIGLDKVGSFCGKIHDLGKATKKFFDYIQPGNTLRRGEVNHTFAAVRYIFEISDGVDNEVRELLAYAVGAHHGQFDAVNDDHKNGFEHRLTKDGIDYDEAKKNFNKYCFSDAELKSQFNEAAEQLTEIIEGIRERNPKRSARQAEEYEFQISLLARLLLSAVIEGDRRDTAEFMENMEFPQVEADWDECLGHIEEKLGEFSNTRPIDGARKQISDICRAAAEEEPGIFRLNVPTGAGKTLSGLRFAVAHAKAYRKKRIVFTSPLLSILDQNAKIIRAFIGDDSIITEHHSNVALDEDNADELKRAQLLTENWSSPVIITTLVQLLDTLFAGKTSCIRRMHALCDSVIVIDEVQTVPNEMLSLFNTAVNFLSEVCGATIVLCSATQPCLEQTAHPITENIKDIVPFDEELWRVFKRTQIIDKGGMRLDAIPAFIAEQLGTTDSLLVICNLKKQAAYLFTEMKLENTVIFHLSAGMCMAHRMAVISEINSALEKRRTDPDAPKVVCISTQVIEAGVDVSFGCVIRLCAGLDSVIQAAGRCNRNGELNGAADVFIINCRGEDLGMLRSIKDGKMACMSLLSDCKYHPEKYPSGLTSDEAVYAYYKKLYIQSDIGAQDMPIKIDGSPFTLFDLLSLDRTFANAPYLKANGEKYALTQAFKTAGSRFTVFGSRTTDVIVPYGEGKEIIAELGSKRAEEDIKYLKKLIKEARAYTVSLYENQRRALADSGALHPIADGIALALSEEFYNEAFGLNLDGESREAITL